jgi:hypothetical protein
MPRSRRPAPPACAGLDARHGLDTVDAEEVGAAFLGLAGVVGIDTPTAEGWLDA